MVCIACALTSYHYCSFSWSDNPIFANFAFPLLVSPSVHSFHSSGYRFLSSCAIQSEWNGEAWNGAACLNCEQYGWKGSKASWCAAAFYRWCQIALRKREVRRRDGGEGVIPVVVCFRESGFTWVRKPEDKEQGSVDDHFAATCNDQLCSRSLLHPDAIRIPWKERWPSSIFLTNPTLNEEAGNGERKGLRIVLLGRKE